ncbi:protein lmbr1l, putative [Acanthamoeba castellanii str. Neff]|uniref:Protein lmbr1l, putative n=1 Tax=Acanthamoeba castellanii (strain ATCC 30010 / Neff) TaxID=1257118 RepID=L8GZR6_ACACF|nr:protein lmbr1l, putative [Acanthamoeba castellanii str. Neff]ELR18013.1 protein lmbr1l, putative [Acanthamoeba castellanii str. Neff]
MGKIRYDGFAKTRCCSHTSQLPELPSEADEAFNALIREWILTLVVFLGLYVASHLTLRRFRFRYPGDAEEQDRWHIPLVLCGVGLTVAFGAMVLVPFTILGHEAMASYGDSWYVKWISYSLILGLWNKIFWGANLSLFFILPLAYFYYEAEGLGGKGALARLYEAAVVFALVSSMLAGLVYLLYNSLSLPTSQYLVFSYSLISMLGSLLFLGTAPLGVLRLASYTTKLARNVRGGLPLSRSNGAAPPIHPSALPFERTALRVRREAASTRWRVVLTHIAYAASLLLGLVMSLFAGYIVVRVALHLFVGLFLTALIPTLAAQLRRSMLAAFAPLSALGTLLDCSAVVYLIPSILLGFYALPGLGRLRPVVGKTSMGGVVANTGAMVLMASSFPVVVDLLGLSRLDLMGAFGCASYARDPWFAACYCIAFLIASVLYSTAVLTILLHCPHGLWVYNFNKGNLNVGPSTGSTPLLWSWCSSRRLCPPQRLSCDHLAVFFAC